MRDPFILASAALLTGLITLGTALAQQRPDWVDPPLRSGTAKDADAKDGGTKVDGTKVDGTKSDAAATRARPVDPSAATAAAPSPAAEASTAPAASTRARISERGPQRRSRQAGRISRDRLVFKPSPVPIADDPRFSDWAGRAQRLTLDYLDNVSAPNESGLAGASRFYGPRVRRFGKSETLAAVIAEKRRFAKRWPERLYAAQPGTIRTSCSAAVMACIVHATFDYRAQNPARRARAQGVGELVLEISFADERPVIVSESGRVLRRGASAALVDAPAKPGA